MRAEPATAPWVGTSFGCETWDGQNELKATNGGCHSKRGNERTVNGARRLVEEPLREPLPQVRQVRVFFEVLDKGREVTLEVSLQPVSGLREGCVKHLCVPELRSKGNKGKGAGRMHV